MSCAVERMAPRKEYLLLELHPERSTPKTPRLPMARENRIPFSKSARVMAGPSGMITQPIRAVISVIKGLKTRMYLFDSLGRMISLMSSLTASAKACKSP